MLLTGINSARLSHYAEQTLIRFPHRTSLVSICNSTNLRQDFRPLSLTEKCKTYLPTRCYLSLLKKKDENKTTLEGPF